MIELPGLEVKTHCFIEEPAALDLTDITRIHPHESFIAEDYEVSDIVFLGLPEMPVHSLREILISIGKKEYADVHGNHLYRLSELRPSVVSLLGSLAENQIEPFCRRWSQHNIFSPFQGWEHLSREEASRICQEKAFQKLCPFLQRLQPLCAQAVDEWKGVYFLEEQHWNPA